MDRLENSIETIFRELNDTVSDEYIEYYSSFSYDKLKSIFSTLHAKLIHLFDMMNSRLPTDTSPNHFWANPSRELLYTIEKIQRLQRNLNHSKFSFVVDTYYQRIIDKCKDFLVHTGGSEIPIGMEVIELYYSLPIFLPTTTVTINRNTDQNIFDLKLIGEGSYAYVYKYKDIHYQEYFVVKRAKKDLTDKEFSRFKQEYDEMRKMRSPYVVSVYCFNENDNEFTMEYMDYTLYDYIQKYNDKLPDEKRQGICRQIIKAFSYIHSKKLLHRDISPKNILVKEYEDVVVIKVSDFGLVKIPESNLTTINTEFKGYFNDPSLRTEGFNTYGMRHEMYALTLIIYFVLTGRTNTDKINNQNLKLFIDKGLNPDKSKRFSSIDELANSFREIGNHYGKTSM